MVHILWEGSMHEQVVVAVMDISIDRHTQLRYCMPTPWQDDAEMGM